MQPALYGFARRRFKGHFRGVHGVIGAVIEFGVQADHRIARQVRLF